MEKGKQSFKQNLQSFWVLTWKKQNKKTMKCVLKKFCSMFVFLTLLVWENTFILVTENLSCRKIFPIHQFQALYKISCRKHRFYLSSAASQLKIVLPFLLHQYFFGKSYVFYVII